MGTESHKPDFTTLKPQKLGVSRLPEIMSPLQSSSPLLCPHFRYCLPPGCAWKAIRPSSKWGTRHILFCENCWRRFIDFIRRKSEKKRASRRCSLLKMSLLMYSSEVVPRQFQTLMSLDRSLVTFYVCGVLNYSVYIIIFITIFTLQWAAFKVLFHFCELDIKYNEEQFKKMQTTNMSTVKWYENMLSEINYTTLIECKLKQTNQSSSCNIFTALGMWWLLFMKWDS